jgi:hypothetical protein
MVDALGAQTADQLTINENVIISGILTVNASMTGAVSASNPYWIALKVNYDGTILTTSGRNTATVNKYSSNSGYAITFPAHPRGVNAIVIVSASEFISFYRNQTATGVRVYTRQQSNAATATVNGNFNVLILA